MKATITEYTFVTDMTREGYGFSTEGARALFEYLETYEKDCETEIEFDPIDFRCEFTEYSDLEEIQGVYDSITDIEDLYYNTVVVEFEGGIIIQDF
jgi:hypothetical protein|tara:strand:+ start:1671 stop:1958 length:288 start_codon:yes stop_codon:yes gene_type:complete